MHEAATIVRHLTIIDANYIEAIKRLNLRYDRKKINHNLVNSYVYKHSNRLKIYSKQF